MRYEKISFSPPSGIVDYAAIKLLDYIYRHRYQRQSLTRGTIVRGVIRNSMRDGCAVESARIRASMTVIPRRGVPEGHRIF